MSGHSKWNNIKRKKEKTDGAKAKVFTKIGREISVVQQRLPQVYFVPGQYSSDNAIGVSILAAREAGLWLK